MSRIDTRPIALRRLALVGVATLALAGCDQIGNPLDAFTTPPAPDEFMVISRAPLEVPESVRSGQPAALPTPQPGAPSPLNPDPLAKAEEALLGNAGQQRNAAADPSQGEAALLAAAARERDPDLDVRAALQADAAADAEAEANAPFQPPTVLELLSGEEPAEDTENLVDPVAESRRLQREGVRAPSDPDAVAPQPEAEATQ
ncbi:MAG: DUF3035 domain-containing protein [Pseudomonadota bacterium]